MRRILLCICIALFSYDLFAQKFGFDADFKTTCDNLEYKVSDRAENLLSSGSLLAVKLTPELFLELPGQIYHRLNLGVDIFKNFGEGKDNWQLFKEITLSYQNRLEFSEGRSFEAIFGCFPRTFAEGDYSEMIFSIETKTLDRNFEGMFFKYRRPRFFAEIGLDWLGMMGDADNPARRERFQVISYGRWEFSEHFHLGWQGKFYHYACSPQFPDNVVDNHNLFPNIGFHSRHFDADLGPALAYCYDRKVREKVTPVGVFSRQHLHYKSFHFTNSFYWGDNQFPFYDKYGPDLYMGRPVYCFMSGRPEFADIVGLKWKPKITEGLYLDFSVYFHIGTPDSAPGMKFFRGWEQAFTLQYYFTTGKK